MTETIPFRSGMILGRTVNIRDNSIGLDIFSELTTATIECPSMTILCELIQSSADVNNVLDISSELSLKVKACHLSMEGIGTYIKEERCENTLEILLRAHVKTMSETLTSSHPKNDWKRSSSGTHYIRSIVYGGDLVARIYTKATDPKIVNEIKGMVKAAFQKDEHISVRGNIKLNTNKHLCEMNISYYSTTLEGEIPTDLGGLLKALMRFTSEVKKINEGKGSPLICELVSVNQIDPDIPVISKVKRLMMPLKQIEEKYDDTKAAEKMLKMFEERNFVRFTEKQHEKCLNIQKRIDCVLEHFNDFIGSMDLTQEETGSKMKSASNVYKENRTRLSFQAEVRQFIDEVETSKKEKKKNDSKWIALTIYMLAAIFIVGVNVLKKTD